MKGPAFIDLESALLSGLFVAITTSRYERPYFFPRIIAPVGRLCPFGTLEPREPFFSLHMLFMVSSWTSLPSWACDLPSLDVLLSEESLPP
jgi:hypothetical protein